MKLDILLPVARTRRSDFGKSIDRLCLAPRLTYLEQGYHHIYQGQQGCQILPHLHSPLLHRERRPIPPSALISHRNCLRRHYPSDPRYPCTRHNQGCSLSRRSTSGRHQLDLIQPCGGDYSCNRLCRQDHRLVGFAKLEDKASLARRSHRFCAVNLVASIRRIRPC